MSSFTVEVTDKFDEPVACSDRVYSDVDDRCVLRENRVYNVSGSGTRDDFKDFVEDVLVDDVSQEWEILDGETALRTDYDQLIDVWLKSDVLDLEEDYLLDYCDDHREILDFEVEDIQIRTRYYVTLNGVSVEIIETLIRDLTNPVIHEWSDFARAHKD